MLFGLWFLPPKAQCMNAEEQHSGAVTGVCVAGDVKLRKDLGLGGIVQVEQLTLQCWERV